MEKTGRSNYLVPSLMLLLMLILQATMKDFLPSAAPVKKTKIVISPMFYRIISADHNTLTSRIISLSVQAEQWYLTEKSFFKHAIPELDVAAELDKKSYYPFFLASIMCLTRVKENLIKLVKFIEKAVYRFPKSPWVPFRLSLIYRFKLNDNAKAYYYAKMAAERTLQYDENPNPFIIAYPAVIQKHISGKEAAIIYLESILNEAKTQGAREEIIKKLKKLIREFEAGE